jgi:ligand-binding sensor domain-containing protein
MHILSRDKSEWLAMTPTREPRMVGENVVDVAFGPGYAYVAFKEDGVYRWDHRGYDWPALTNLATDSWAVSVAKTDLPSIAKISRLALRSDGRLWIATSAGLFYYEDIPVVDKTREVPVYTGVGPGIIDEDVRDILLDHDENLWVATLLGLNRIARDDNNDIQAFMTASAFVALSGLRYPLDVISPLANSDCKSLAIHATEDILYIGTFGGLSVHDFSPPPPTPTDLSRVYVYPNPLYGSRGHDALMIANLTGPVTVEIYNLEGELVDARGATADGDVVWDLRTRDGFLTGSGNYIVRIVGPTGSVQKTIAVIR